MDRNYQDGYDAGYQAGTSTPASCLGAAVWTALGVAERQRAATSRTDPDTCYFLGYWNGISQAAREVQ